MLLLLNKQSTSYIGTIIAVLDRSVTNIWWDAFETTQIIAFLCTKPYCEATVSATLE